MNRSLFILLVLIITAAACTLSEAAPQTPLAALSATAFSLQTEAIPTGTALPSFTPPPTDEYKQVDLLCETYIETTWGNDAGEWGDPSQLPQGGRDVFPPPAFDERGALYISDFANHRLLKYENKTSSPVEIPLPEEFFYDPSPFHEPWATIEITGDSILVPYGANKLGILSIDGTERKSITLPYNYYLLLSPWILVRVDSRGGLFINGEKHAYFDVGWRDEQWLEISSGPAPQVGLFTWNDFVGCEAWAGAAIALYKINPAIDFFNTSPLLVVDLPTYGGDRLWGLIIGADRAGWVYLKTSIQSTRAYVRYSIPSAIWQIGVIRDHLPAPIIQSGVAPDGTIYLIVYAPEDATVQPKIVKCRFPED